MRKAIDVLRVASAWMLAAIVLASGSSGLVLCIGDDEHVAVEPAHQGHCDRTDRAAGRAHGETALSVANSVMSGVGACVDVSLDVDKLSHAVKNVRPARLLNDSNSEVFSAGHVALASIDDHVSRRLVGAATPRLSHFLLALRTIVLRI